MKLLAILAGAQGTPACLDAAALALRSLGRAEIEALHIKVDPDHMIAPMEEIDIQRLRERREGTADERATAVHKAFLAWTAQAPDRAAVRWKTLTGPEEALVCREAEQADVIVTVLARESNLDARDALHAGIFRSGKPVLLVPAGWRRGARTSFAHVAVGLSDSEATRHAIAGAGPWLRAADQVTAIRIGERDDAALGMTRLLTEAGARAELHVVQRSSETIGAQIIAEANAVCADLVVAGAYRHPEMIEWLLGSTTRHLIAAANLPLLLSH